MATTTRIAVRKNAPTTDFYLYADRVWQSYTDNYTTIRMYLGAINRGNTTSFANGFGQQGLGVLGMHDVQGYVANPFMPRGVPNGEWRWFSGPYNIDIVHNPDGTRPPITLYMTLTYIDEPYQIWTVPFDDFPRIPRGPRVRSNGVYKQSVVNVKSNGVWKPAIPYVKSNGVWKISGG